uniref:Receptor-like serine/threonine-protein kinase n=1 Tax=Fagus sylvatica TaxID=28930 RepID=A0A2N9GXL2_FAGSY
MSSSDKLSLTTNGLIVTNQTGQVLWSTPFLTSKVAAMLLLDTGNLVLVDAGNAKLWESFDYPTDAIVVGQRIPVGKSLESSVSEDDMSLGDYRLEVTDRDVVLQWNRMDYWKLSSDSMALKNSNGTVSWMVMNDTGLYLLGSDGSTVVIQVLLNGPPGIKIDCKIPFICGEIGLCTTRSLGRICSCPPGFHSQIGGGNCVPENTSLSLPSACNGSQLNSSISYLKLGLGFYHENASGSCYLLENHLGSFRLTPFNNPRLGYIKALVVSSLGNPVVHNKSKKYNFPIAGLVLIPLTGFFLIVFVIFAILLLRKNRLSKIKTVKASAELEMISIPGLPRRFAYEELVAATENFKTHIGSGGFGTVYKGTLTDQTDVAVKKITNFGVQGNREFCTEMFNNWEHPPCQFEWQERVEIALGIARGLAYLHSGCEQRIIHCDVKPENILLHDNLQVKISDFGISKLLSREQSTFFTALRGTRGYLAPEWLTGTPISDKADVYSYGMVLLEIVTGRKNCSLQTHGLSSYSSSSEPRLIYFPLIALQMHERRRYMEVADPRLEGGVTSEEVEKLVRIALCCVHQDPTLRPTMANIVGMLEGGLPLSEPRVRSLNFLRAYGQRFTETLRMQGSNEQNELGLNLHMNATSNGASSGIENSLSYITSQQLSGPR